MRSFLKACHMNCGACGACEICGTPNIIRLHDIYKNCAVVMLVLINQKKSKRGRMAEDF
jgi:positive regulator of sigma E activity